MTATAEIETVVRVCEDPDVPCPDCADFKGPGKNDCGFCDGSGLIARSTLDQIEIDKAHESFLATYRALVDQRARSVGHHCTRDCKLCEVVDKARETFAEAAEKYSEAIA